MILAVDVGNSNTTVGLFDTAGKLSFLSSLGTDRERTRDQCAIDLLGVFSLYQADSKRISGAILSSVVPPLTATMTEAISMLDVVDVHALVASLSDELPGALAELKDRVSVPYEG